MTETSSSPMTRRDTMIRHSSSARSNVVPLSVDKPVARATANIEWSVYAVCPEGFTARGWLCISGTIVPAAPQIHITRVVVSQCPSVSLALSLLLSVCPFVRIRDYSTVWRLRENAFSLFPCFSPRQRPTRSICKPPRNESVNPVTSFAAILALRRRYSGHFPTNPPNRSRLECKSRAIARHRTPIADANSRCRDYRQYRLRLNRLCPFCFRIQKCAK